MLEKSTPFFFIEGVADDRDPSCRPDIPEFSRMSRRLNMYRRLVTHPVDLLVIIGVSEVDGAGDLAVILREAQVREMTLLGSASGTLPTPLDRVKVLVPGIPEFVNGVIRKALDLRGGDRLDVRCRIDVLGKTVSVDLTECEAVGHPIRDRFEIITEHDLHQGVLTEAEIEGFLAAITRAGELSPPAFRGPAARLGLRRYSGRRKSPPPGAELDATVWLDRAWSGNEAHVTPAELRPGRR